MQFLDELYLEKDMAGCSTGSRWQRSGSKTRIQAVSPVDGQIFGEVGKTTVRMYDRLVDQASATFLQWRLTPAPVRGDIIRKIGLRFREFKRPLGTLIAWETGKSLQEGLGEVQEVIDICDYCVGLSRTLYGMTTVSERPNHRLFEQYHPLGVVGIITAFNFPAAVWSWNAMVAAVCGNVCVWKPSSKAVATAVAIQKIIGRELTAQNLPEGIFSLAIGDRSTIGGRMLDDIRIPLVSFTGSVNAGRTAAQRIARRLGKAILELGGNNAIILTSNADLDLAIPATVFGAVGTTGQRCTTTRRLIIHDSIFDQVVARLRHAYDSLKIGNPLLEQNHLGPLIDRKAVKQFEKAIKTITKQGGTILFGGHPLKGPGYESGCYVEPTLAEVAPHLPVVKEETFAPILYLIRYGGEVEEAIRINNDVSQGLSSSIFSTDIRETESFLSCRGSDCGLANVNIGTSGAEIGAAFGGEKDTGGGRESGSDSWKSYMRRQTVTINYGTDLPLAQGINFQID